MRKPTTKETEIKQAETAKAVEEGMAFDILSLAEETAARLREHGKNGKQLANDIRDGIIYLISESEPVRNAAAQLYTDRCFGKPSNTVILED